MGRRLVVPRFQEPPLSLVDGALETVTTATNLCGLGPQRFFRFLAEEGTRGGARETGENANPGDNAKPLANPVNTTPRSGFLPFPRPSRPVPRPLLASLSPEFLPQTEKSASSLQLHTINSFGTTGTIASVRNSYLDHAGSKPAHATTTAAFED